MTTMFNDDDTLFLPTPQDRLKAEISDLRKRLQRANEAKERLQREIMEEKIAHFAAARFSDENKDWTRYKASQMKQVQQQIFEQMMAATWARCIQEVVGYYRLSGRTTFDFQKRYTGIRLETFYNGTFHEPYYLLIRQDAVNRNQASIERHTIPYFIPMERLEKQFMPHDQETLLRILHDFLLAYVARREQMKELEELAEDRPSLTVVPVFSDAKNKITIVEKINEQRPVKLVIEYENLASDRPTKVEIRNVSSSPESSVSDYGHAEEVFFTHKLIDAYRSVFDNNA